MGTTAGSTSPCGEKNGSKHHQQLLDITEEILSRPSPALGIIIFSSSRPVNSGQPLAWSVLRNILLIQDRATESERETARYRRGRRPPKVGSEIPSDRTIDGRDRANGAIKRANVLLWCWLLCYSFRQHLAQKRRVWKGRGCWLRCALGTMIVGNEHNIYPGREKMKTIPANFEAA